MGTGDENRWWADPDERLRVFDVDPETGHYRRFFDIDDLAGVRVEDPEVFELTHRKVLSLLCRRGDRGAADRPSRRARRPGRLPRAAGRRGRRSGLGREDPAPRRGAARLARERHRRLRVPQRRAGAVRRSGGRGVPDAAALRADRRDALLRRGRAGGAARAGARDVSPRGRSACARSTTPAIWRRRSRGCRSTARTCATASSRTADRAALAAAGRPDLFDGAPEEFVSRFQQTSPPVTAKGIEDTAFYRYVRLLALQRRRRRSWPLGRLGRRVPCRQPRARAPLSREPARHADARHEALGRRARPDRRAQRDGGGLGDVRAALV